jgi:hypothetical protein
MIYHIYIHFGWDGEHEKQGIMYEISLYTYIFIYEDMLIFIYIHIIYIFIYHLFIYYSIYLYLGWDGKHYKHGILAGRYIYVYLYMYPYLCVYLERFVSLFSFMYLYIYIHLGWDGEHEKHGIMYKYIFIHIYTY